jgi:thioredoxin-related protein
MKKVFALMLSLFICGGVFAQGIEFEHTNFAEVLAKAKKENKMVFMDCYTSWCGPCKMLSKKVFPQKEVGDYFNANFVNFKVDMEKGEGVELQKKYQVKAFPTLLFLDANGKVLHKMVGGSDAAGLIAEAKVATDPSQRIGALEKRYADGERSEAFVAKYIKALQKAYRQEEMAKVGKDYLANTALDKLNSEDAFTIIAYTGIEYKGKIYKHLLANKAKFVEVAGQKSYDYVVANAMKNYLSAAATNGSLDELKTKLEECKKDSPQVAQMEGQLIGQYYLSHKEYKNWLDHSRKAAREALATDKKMGLSMCINAAYRVAMDPAFENAGVYEQAIEMTLKAKEIDPEFIACYYCLASLYKKTGDKEKALANINTFIKKNEETGGKADARVTQLKKDIESM